MRVWPASGMLGVLATRSMLMLPTTTIGFLEDVILLVQRLIQGRESNSSQPEKEEDKHQHQEPPRDRWSAGKLVPNENAPACRNHRCALPDGIRNGWPHFVGSGSQKVCDRANAPDHSAEDPCKMPAPQGAPVIRSEDAWLPIERFPHQKHVRRHGGEKDADRKEHGDRIGAWTRISALPVHR